jgi:hypothetical protein
MRVLERHGRSLEGADDTPDELAAEQPVLASCYAASAADVQLLGAAPGQKTAKRVQPVRRVPSQSEPLAEVAGVNVHAKVAFDGRDRPRLERLCRYLARPPLAEERLSLHHDGRVRLAFKAPWKDGTHAVLLDPLDFLARLAALVPPPRFHMLRYHGVLAAHASVRAEVVPGREPPTPPQLPLFEASDAPLEPPPPSRHPWPWLLRRVFAVEVSVCPLEACGGRMRVVEIAIKPDDVARVRKAQPLERPRARAPPPPKAAQLRLAFA